MVISQGEIWWAELPDPAGSGPGFRRPVVVVQGDSLNRSRIPNKLHVCFDPSPANKDCLSVPGASRFEKIAYANAGVGEEHDVVVLVQKASEGGFFYLLSPKDGALKKAIHLTIVMVNGKADHIDSDLLDTKDRRVIRDVQVQVDFWNDKYEKWVASEKKL